MKRKYGDGSSWKRLIEKAYTVKQVEAGMLGILDIKKVREPSYEDTISEGFAFASDGYILDAILL